MQPTKLTISDQVGWYKNREIGFPGLCCKHCGGRPSFGRYFPSSARNFGQSTTIETIEGHLGLYCKECPEDIKKLVTKLQQIDNSRRGEQLENGENNRESQNKRKKLYDLVWERLYTASAQIGHENSENN
jgi:hypothetical protein